MSNFASVIERQGMFALTHNLFGYHGDIRVGHISSFAGGYTYPVTGNQGGHTREEHLCQPQIHIWLT
jgi:hypothetical protein